MFHSIDLCGAKTTWKTVGEIAHNCTELKIVNMSRTKGEILEYPLIQATNIVELHLSETLQMTSCLFSNLKAFQS